MLDPNSLRNESDVIAEKLVHRGLELDVDKLDVLEERRKVLQVKTENLQAERNSQSKSIGQAKARGEDIELSRLEMNELGGELDATKAGLDTLQAEIRDIALIVPNLPTDEVLVGKDESDNAEVSRWGTSHEFDFKVRDHVTLGEMRSGLDFTAAVKLIGPHFAVMKGQIARMHHALSQFVLGLHTEQHSYSEDYVPYLINQDTLYSMGQSLKFADDLLYTRPLEEETDISNYALIPTAEVPLTSLVHGEIIDEDDLSIKMTTHTPCFRSETSSYGRDARGLTRAHQFDKVEMVRIVRPEDSMAVLEEMTGRIEKVLQLLGLSYRKIILCTGDVGFGAFKTYGLEAWIPAQSVYREISSCSNVRDFQTRRMRARCRSESDKKARLAHTLNGSDPAVGRTLVAVVENYQRADGHIEVPEALRPYMNGLEYTG